ncbi:hypothetical protein B0H11DRAFT_1267659 [Mycena galericulata]|nr:hypothetical protein B0H11DRAFT_1267659 [Mycena galericulata]
MAHRTPRSTSARASPYDTGHGQFINFHSNVTNYYSPPPDSFASEWRATDFAAFNYYDSASSPPDSYYYDSASSTPSAAAEPLALTTPKKKRPTRKPRPANHVARPRNSFIIFRSEFYAMQRITPKVEDDHRIISRVAAILWHDLPEEDKREYQVKAELEKLEHRRLHPNYRFLPVVRAQKPLKRKVQRNGPEDLERCREIAELLKAGKQGDELEEAVRSLNLDRDADSTTQEPSNAPDVRGWQPQDVGSENLLVPDLLPSLPIIPEVAPLPSLFEAPYLGGDLSDVPSQHFHTSNATGYSWQFDYAPAFSGPLPPVSVEPYEDTPERAFH